MQATKQSLATALDTTEARLVVVGQQTLPPAGTILGGAELSQAAVALDRLVSSAAALQALVATKQA